MRRYFIIVFILASITAIFGGCCFGSQISAENMLGTGSHIERYILYPWTTFAFLSIGMVLIVIQNIESRIHNYAGTIGTILVGITFAAYIAVGTGSLAALLLFLAGVALIMIEARVLPGHGICAITGIICEFAGVYLILGGAENGIFFPAAMALMVSILSSAAFLAYISGNSTWKSILHNIELEKSQPSSTIDIDISNVKPHNVQGTGNRKACGTVQIATQVGRISTQTPLDTTTQDEVTQTSQPDNTAHQLNSLKMMKAEIETCALPVLADQHRMEQNLQKAKESLASLQNDAHCAAKMGNDDLAGEILVQADICRSKIEEISQKLNKLITYSDAAREHIRTFEEELHKAEIRNIDNESRMQIAAMRAELRHAMDEGIRVIENIEDRADMLCAEAEALEEINSISGKNQQQIDELNARKQRADQALAELKAKLGRQTSGNSSTSSQPPCQNPDQRIINKD